jgi:K+-sensing histidine kinase KdpD
LNETFSFSEDSIEIILDFIEKIKSLSTSDISCLNLRPEWVSIDLLIKQIFAELRQQNLDTSRIQLNSSCANCTIYMDKYLFLCILVNLLSNALKFSIGEVELVISTSENNLSIIVRDFGIGIPENQIKEVFIPFVRGRNVNRIKGSGMGLSVVANAIKCLKGSFTLHSVIAKGTEFKIVIPNCNRESDLNIKTPENNLINQIDLNESEYSLVINTISHEIRSPLAVLKSNIQILRKLTFDLDNGIKEQRLVTCEESLTDVERIFKNLKFLKTNIQTGYKRKPTQLRIRRIVHKFPSLFVIYLVSIKILVAKFINEFSAVDMEVFNF